MNYYTCNGELRHHGILGMRWGVRRYQNKDGTLTPLGKKHLAEKGIRTEDNLVEKTIPKGTKMYRVTPDEKDKYGGKSLYVSLTDVDRDYYKQGGFIKRVNGKKTKDPVYEHEYELSTDIRVPSLKMLREIENKVMANDEKRKEVVAGLAEIRMSDIFNYNVKEMNDISHFAKELRERKTSDKIKSFLDEMLDEYGDTAQVLEYYRLAQRINTAREFIDLCDNLSVEQSLGRSPSVKAAIIKELKSLGYNAMYDNASIGVGSDGEYSKHQEGLEPLLIFNSRSTLRETTVQKIDIYEQKEASKRYNVWKKDINKALRNFK